MKLFNRKKKLPMGTKEQGGPETFKFNSAWNDKDKKFFISLVSRKSYHTARLNLEPEEYAVILNRMVAAYERQVYPDNKHLVEDMNPKGGMGEFRKPVGQNLTLDSDLQVAERFLAPDKRKIDPDDEMKELAGK